MSDTALIVIGGIVVAAIGIVPTMYQAFSANHKLKDVKQILGETNGNGDVSQMLAHVMAWQAEQTKAQEDALAAIRVQEDGLTNYSQDSFHHLINLMTVVKGKVDLMWPHFRDQYGLQDAELPEVPYPDAVVHKSWESYQNRED